MFASKIKALPLKLRFLIFAMGLVFIVLNACQPIPDPSQEASQKTRQPTSTGKSNPSTSTNKKSTQTPTVTPQPTSTLDVKPSDLEGAEIVFWHIWSGAAGEIIDELTAEFEASNEWGITVESYYQGDLDQIFEITAQSLESNENPDITVSYNYQALTWDPSGETFADLNQYAFDPVWGFSAEEQSDFYPVFWEHDRLADQRIGLPAQRSGQFLYYNQTWAEELGFKSPPQTPADFKKQACAAGQVYRQDDDPTNDSKGGWVISTDYSSMLGWIQAFGGEVVRADLKGYQFDSPEAKETFTFLRDLYDQGCAWLAESQIPEAEFATRQGLFISGSVVGIPYQEAVFADVSSTDKWMVIPFPSLQEEPVIEVYGPSFQIWKSSPEKELASWIFIKWLTSPENQAKLAQVSGYFPVRTSSLEYIGLLAEKYPQWSAAVSLLQYAHPEPSYASWHTARWAVSDAATQLYRYYFSIDQVPSLVKLLHRTANTLHSGNQ